MQQDIVSIVRIEEGCIVRCSGKNIVYCQMLIGAGETTEHWVICCHILAYSSIDGADGKYILFPSASKTGPV
jgi:hypothetical protein